MRNINMIESNSGFPWSRMEGELIPRQERSPDVNVLNVGYQENVGCRNQSDFRFRRYFSDI